MTRNYYKSHAVTGGLFIALTAFLVLMNLSDCRQSYHGVVFNRYIFTVVWLPLFLCGFLPIFPDLSKPEGVIRHKNRREIWKRLIRSLFCYSLWISILYCAVNGILSWIFQADHIERVHNMAVFYILSFLFQIAGWFFISSVFCLIYTGIHHGAGSWGIVEVLLAFFTAVTQRQGTETFSAVFSPYHLMYQFVVAEDYLWLLIVFLGEIVLSGICLTCSFLIFRRQDIMGNERGE